MLLIVCLFDIMNRTSLKELYNHVEEHFPVGSNMLMHIIWL